MKYLHSLPTGIPESYKICYQCQISGNLTLYVDKNYNFFLNFTIPIPFEVGSSSYYSYYINNIIIDTSMKCLKNNIINEWEKPNLQKINLGNLEIIESNNFVNCYNLKELKLPSTLTYIGENCFDNCGIRKITIPKNIKTLCSNNPLDTLNGCFCDCDNLEKIILECENIFPELTSLRAFTYCSNLSYIFGNHKQKEYYSSLERLSLDYYPTTFYGGKYKIRELFERGELLTKSIQEFIKLNNNLNLVKLLPVEIIYLIVNFI